MPKTKIYGTIGPASYQTKRLVSLISAGMYGIRINLSHGNLATYYQWFNNLQQAQKITGTKVNTLADIQGPEIRTGSLVNKNIELDEGETVTIVFNDFPGNKDKISINHPELKSSMQTGQIILIDDGLIKLITESVTDSSIICRVIRGGILGERKGVNLPGLELSLPSLTKKDLADIQTAITFNIDLIMLPFTRSLQDIITLRNYLNTNHGQGIGIMAKIENQTGINNLPGFIEQLEGVIIARGDLGVEVGLPKIPLIQKEIIKICNQYQKESIVVTHMLHSMLKSPLPTRAEISDIANAVLDGCTGVMLTGETAVGDYPVQALKIMKETVVATENWQPY